MFTQMTDEAHKVYPDWSPNFGDYLYLSLTNASAFSPTDALPLTAGRSSPWACSPWLRW